MSDTEICRKVLEKILNVPIKKVEFPVTKKITDIAPDSGDIRLDACIHDEQETIYSVEMLCCKDEELLKKARYFQCNIDSDIILPGKGAQSWRNRTSSLSAPLIHFPTDDTSTPLRTGVWKICRWRSVMKPPRYF